MNNLLRRYFSVILFSLISFSSIVFAQEKISFIDFPAINLEEVNEVKITTETDNWQYLLDSLRYNGDEFLSIKSLSINDKDYSKASIAYIEESKFEADQLQRSLWLNVNGDKLVRVNTFEKDPSLIREKLSTDIYNHFMVVPQTAYAKVLVNDEFYGFMLLQEQVTPSFVEYHLGKGDQTSIVKTRPLFSVEDHEGCISNNYASLLHEKNAQCLNYIFEGDQVEELRKVTNALQGDLKSLEMILDINSALWMLALNDVTLNFDSYTGLKSTNFYLVKDQFGRYNFIPFGFELAFGGKKRVTEGSDFTLDQMVNLPLAFHKDNRKYPLVRALLNNETYYKAYLSNCRAVMDYYYQGDRYLELAKQYQSIVESNIEQDPFLADQKEKMLDNLYSTVGKRSKVPGIQEIVDARYAFLKKETVLKVLGPEILDYTFKKRARFSNEKIKDFDLMVQTDKYAESVKIHFRFSDQEAFRSIDLSEKKTENEQTFAVKITPPEGYRNLEFYFELDNAKMKSFFPLNYEQATLQADLNTLNK